MRFLFLALSILCLRVCSAQSSSDSSYVVLVSFDGFRNDYVEKFQAPNFIKFIREGASSKGLIPCFPSKTFPNHYSIVTGLYPGNHGIVDNTFIDPTSGKKYSMKNKAAVQDSSFYHGVPLWQLAQQQGMKTASLFWVGSEAPIRGAYPSYSMPYKESMPNEERIDQVVNWLKMPAQQRPHFISLYFSLVDTEGHTYGPESRELKKTVLKADSLVGMLSSSLAALPLPIHTIIVSDHGMANLKQSSTSFIALEDLINLTDTTVTVVNDGTQTHFYTARVDSLYAHLQANATDYSVYRRADFPARWHYNNPRSGDVLMVAHPRKYIVTKRASLAFDNAMIGEHGYDPKEVRSMNGIFYAKGPRIKAGCLLEPFENIHIYPFIAHLLGLKTGVIDGDEKVLNVALKQGR